MRDRRWLPELDEHDKELYESELMYDRWLQGHESAAGTQPGEASRRMQGSNLAPPPALDGYDRDRDDPNGYVGADERERDLKGEQ